MDNTRLVLPVETALDMHRMFHEFMGLFSSLYLILDEVEASKQHSQAILDLSHSTNEKLVELVPRIQNFMRLLPRYTPPFD